jgi:hypothetical protein
MKPPTGCDSDDVLRQTAPSPKLSARKLCVGAFAVVAQSPFEYAWKYGQ